MKEPEGKKANLNKKDFWDKKWGKQGYDPIQKREQFSRVFNLLEAKGMLGEVIVDIGSGHESVTDYLANPDKHKIITVDISGERDGTNRWTHVPYDVEKMSERTTVASKRAAVQVANFLGVDPRTKDPARVNTMILSEILNYVDSKDLLTECAKYLKVGGRFVILNKPTRGFPEVFSKNKIKNNTELVKILESLNFETEQLAFGDRHNIDGASVLIVARRLAKEEEAGAVENRSL